MDPGRAPLRVFPADPLDEISQATIDLRPPCPLSGFPAPEGCEARAVSARAGSSRPQSPVTAAQPKMRRRTPQGDAELMTKKQVLGFKPAPRLEQVGDEHSERVHDREHRSGHAMILPYDAKPGRMRFSERTMIQTVEV